VIRLSKKLIKQLRIAYENIAIGHALWLDNAKVHLAEIRRSFKKKNDI
jgi:hypothetical protein